MRVFLASILCAVVCVGTPSAGEVTENEIAVTASAVAYVKSDYATFNINISSMSKKAAEATKQTADLHQRVVSVLRDMGVLDVHTQQYRITQRWKRNERGENKKFLGYLATHVVAVRLVDIEAAVVVVGAVIQTGVKDVGSIQFHSDATDSLHQVTLDAAARQARESAESIAAVAGGVLGDLIEFSTQDAVRATRRGNPAGPQHPRIVAGTRNMPGATLIRSVVLARWTFVKEGDQRQDQP